MSNDVSLKNAFDLTPTSLDQAMQFAKLMAESDLVPKAYQGKPGNVLIAVQMGSEVGLPPMAAIQNIAVINGKPGLYGDAGRAILLKYGCMIDEDDTAIIKKTGFARCKITRPGRVPVERTFSVDDAKRANLYGKDGPWKNYTERQMAWRAFWFAARDAASDLLKGLGGAEELRDIPTREVDVTPSPAAIAEPKQPEAKPAMPAETFDKNFPAYQKGIVEGRKTAADVLATVETRWTLNEDQKRRINEVKPKPAESGPIEGTAERVEDTPPKKNYALIMNEIIKAHDLDELASADNLIRENITDEQQSLELKNAVLMRRKMLMPKE